MTMLTLPQSGGRPSPIRRENLPAGVWSHRIMFRHGQCDPAGIVYTPNFFDIASRTLEVWFSAALGLDYYDIIGRRRIGLGYGSASASFFSPCRMGEAVELFVCLERVGHKSYTLVLPALRDDEEVFRVQLTTVTTSLDGHGAIAVPEDIAAALRRYRGAEAQ